MTSAKRQYICNAKALLLVKHDPFEEKKQQDLSFFLQSTYSRPKKHSYIAMVCQHKLPPSASIEQHRSPAGLGRI